MASDSEPATFYTALGVLESATQDEIKKAYRKLSMKWHPDKNHNSNESNTQFHKIGEAYECLKDPQLKHAYDVKLNATMGAKLNRMPTMFQQSHASGKLSEMLFDIFFQTGAQMASGTPMMSVAPIVEHITITLSQAYYGANVMVMINRRAIKTLVGLNDLENMVPIYVDIPRGIDSGERVIIPNSGHERFDGSAGEVHIIVHVEDHETFKRTGLDISMVRSITLKEALCGLTFTLEHLNGEMYTIKNARGKIIYPDYKKQIPKLGMVRNSHTGNLIICFEIEFPKKLNEVQIDALIDILSTTEYEGMRAETV